MEVKSAFSAGVQGFQNAQQQASEAAANIANATSSPATDNLAAENVNATSQLAGSSEQVINVNQEVVDLKVAEHQAKASAQVIKSADESLGTLIDVTA